eukprot:TRINITY_DN2286_c1_g1_i9.p2 TRINITY_DN2286_c1_g1~~TRINITY_DN2286_c1_g1_i9.p2  ORF type:complete len:148 (-),score=16.11 TRINITY_DN2286_c1_g1_i9:55-498(-)
MQWRLHEPHCIASTAVQQPVVSSGVAAPLQGPGRSTDARCPATAPLEILPSTGAISTKCARHRTRRVGVAWLAQSECHRVWSSGAVVLTIVLTPTQQQDGALRIPSIELSVLLATSSKATMDEWALRRFPCDIDAPPYGAGERPCLQ